MACFLLHNFIRRDMSNDPLEAAVDGESSTNTPDQDYIQHEYINYVDPTPEWTQFRDSIAMTMWNNR